MKKLTDETVLEIYLSEKPQCELKKEYGLSKTTVWCICNRYGRFKDVIRKTLSQKPKKKSPYAGIVTCLKCDRTFHSPNKREFRICGKCSKKNELIYNNLGYGYIYDVEGAFDDIVKK